jgi:Arc/MetJ-type ribon-helix-helix transcriptional regulator
MRQTCKGIVMSTLTIPLSDELHAFLEAQAAAGGFRDPAEYVQTLIVDAQQAVERHDELKAKLLEGVAALDRGEGRVMTSSDWERLRQQYRARHGIGDGA